MSTKTDYDNRKIGLLRGIGYVLGDFYGGGSGALTGTYLTLFWTTFAGLTMAQAGAIQGMTLMVSAVTAMIVGAVSDNFYKTKLGEKFGRRRIFLLLGAPLLLFGILMWIPGLSYNVYLGAFFIWSIMNQVIMIPYSTLPSEMTTDFDKRTILSTTRMFMSGFAGAIIPIVGGIMLKILGDKQASTYTTIGTVFTIIFALMVFVVYFTTWERPIEEADLVALKESRANPQKFSLSRILKQLWQIIVDYASTLRNRSFQRHMAIYLLGVTSMDVFSAVFMFYVINNLGLSVAYGSFLLSLAIVWQPFTPLQGWLFTKLGANKMYAMTFGTLIALLLAYYGIWKSGMTGHTLNITLAVVVVLWLFFKGLIYFLPWNIFPFIPDVDEMITRRRREGSYSAMVLFLRRLTQGFSTIVVFNYLNSVGYKAGETARQGLAVQTGIANVMVFWVIGGSVLALIIALGFKLNKNTHAVLLAEMDRLKAGGSKEDVTPETRRIVQNLTGLKYEKLWPAIPGLDIAEKNDNHSQD